MGNFSYGLSTSLSWVDKGPNSSQCHSFREVHRFGSVWVSSWTIVALLQLLYWANNGDFDVSKFWDRSERRCNLRRFLHLKMLSTRSRAIWNQNPRDPVHKNMQSQYKLHGGGAELFALGYWQGSERSLSLDNNNTMAACKWVKVCMGTTEYCIRKRDILAVLFLSNYRNFKLKTKVPLSFGYCVSDPLTLASFVHQVI